jgi:two-component system, cell cycle sensor histidine kinase and response regulator CckA
VEAIGERKGEIVLALDVLPASGVGKSKLFPHDWEVKANEYVRLSVADTGHGIDQGVLDKIFDPFYTTRFAGTSVCRG